MMKKHYNLYYIFLEDKQRHPMPEHRVIKIRKKIKKFFKTIKPSSFSKPLIITTSEPLDKNERNLKK